MKSPSLHFIFLLLYFTTLLSISGCTQTPKPDPAKEIEALALLQNQEQRAHLEEQPALLVNMLNDTLVQIKNGEVSYYTKDQMTERFITYFERVEFLKWEDTHPPAYTLSEDATMANILNRKIVILNDVSGTTPVRDTTLFAWTELWKKKDGRWKMYQVTTTDVKR